MEDNALGGLVPTRMKLFIDHHLKHAVSLRSDTLRFLRSFQASREIITSRPSGSLPCQGPVEPLHGPSHFQEDLSKFASDSFKQPAECLAYDLALSIVVLAAMLGTSSSMAQIRWTASRSS
ncbi:hypothetical protein LWI29_009976 [Acer saccharum]|uniref:Uncharacterized protein n=1 Tax=Acer saccharum TaxID=4024 RepID=A0AA39W185_ACESA|nr:hypothetical protein LWI29_009976 [Acer saccharum]